MLKYKIRELKEGMIFSASLLSDDGETLLQKKIPIKKEDVLRWATMGISEVFCRGEVIDEGEDTKSALDRIREQLEAQKEAANLKKDDIKPNKNQAYATKDELLKAKIYESKLYSLEIVEQIIDGLTLGLNHFLQSPKDPSVLREKLIYSSEGLIKEMRKNPSHILDAVCFIESGNSFVSHAVRVAVIGVYTAMQLDTNYKRLLIIATSAFLHDIGKVAYNAVNELERINVSKDKMNIALTHPVYGYKVAKNFLRLQDEVCQAILNHHEQPDGKGFPRRVADIKLFITDKILYLSNVFAHLIEKNQLEGYMTPLKNLDYLIEHFPDKFDPRLSQKLKNINNLEGYESLHRTPSPEKTVINPKKV